MAAISKITIYGFKAFPQEFELNLDGKNLLMYGENVKEMGYSPFFDSPLLTNLTISSKNKYFKKK